MPRGGLGVDPMMTHTRTLPGRMPGGGISRRPLQVVIIADCSGSMTGEKIQALNFAIAQMIQHLGDGEIKRLNLFAGHRSRAVGNYDYLQWAAGYAAARHSAGQSPGMRHHWVHAKPPSRHAADGAENYLSQMIQS